MFMTIIIHIDQWFNRIRHYTFLKACVFDLLTYVSNIYSHYVTF